MFKFKFTKNLRVESKFFIFNFKSSSTSSVIFNRVYANFKQFLSSLGQFPHSINLIRDRVQVRVQGLWLLEYFYFFVFSSIFILLALKSDQCAIQARLEVAGHLSATSRWVNPAKCLSQRHNK